MPVNKPRAARRGSLPIEHLQKFFRVFAHSRDDVTQPEEELDLGDMRRTHPTLPYEAFAKSPSWKNVQKGVISLFKKEPWSLESFIELENCLRLSLSEDIGEHIMDFYQNHLVRRGMQVLTNEFDLVNSDLSSLPDKLSSAWSFFYGDLMPTLELLMSALAHDGLRLVTMTAFRDLVLLRSGIERSFKTLGSAALPATIKQMLLVLHYHRDTTPPSSDFLRLESLAAQLVTPFQGYQGYYGALSPHPTLRSPSAVNEAPTNHGPPLNGLKPALVHSDPQGSPVRARRLDTDVQGSPRIKRVDFMVKPALRSILEHSGAIERDGAVGTRERSHSLHCAPVHKKD